MIGRDLGLGDGVTRRRLLVGGGAGIGLLSGWAVWPRSYAPNLVAASGETIFDAYLKIGQDGHVTVAVPQAEAGQGVYTTLAQIVADELGADWRTIAVEAAPINPLYANRLLATELATDLAPSFAGIADDVATRSAMMATAGSTSIRMFEAPMRQAAAAARVRLCKAAAARWDVAWEACDAQGGFVIHEAKKLRFAVLAAEAAELDAPDPLPLRMNVEGRIVGRSVPRIDLPSKIDGSANFTADVRLPNMVFAAIRQGPIGASRLVRVDKAAADRVAGVLAVVENAGWVAAVANSWWAANRALDAMAPRFETRGAVVDDAGIEAVLAKAFEGPGQRLSTRGDLLKAFKGATIEVADYAVAPAAHASIEPVCATASWENDALELWLPTLAPERARAAAAAAIGVAEARVAVHPMLVGGGFGRGLDSEAAAQVAILAVRMKRPVQLQWSRAEDTIHDRFRPAAAAQMSARLAPGNRIEGWLAKIASPAYGHAVADSLLGENRAAVAVAQRGADGFAVAGAMPPYAIPNLAVDHHPAIIPLPVGYHRGGAHAYTAFFTESFIDELARVAGAEPFSYRMAMLGGSPRLARCLSTVAALGGWQGGGAGTGQGIACHSAYGSHVAVLAEARVEEGRVFVDRLVAVADVGRVIHPDIVRQQIEGALIYGMATALGCAPGFEDGLTRTGQLRDLDLPTLAQSPEISVEVVRSNAAPGGASEVAVPPVAPAIANALFAGSGQRFRRLPIRLEGEA